MGIVRYTNADTLGDIGSVSELVQQYRNHEILTKYGLSISEYFEMPAHIAKIIVSTVKTEKQDMTEIMEDSERKAKQEMKKNR